MATELSKYSSEEAVKKLFPFLTRIRNYKREDLGSVTKITFQSINGIKRGILGGQVGVTIGGVALMTAILTLSIAIPPLLIVGCVLGCFAAGFGLGYLIGERTCFTFYFDNTSGDLLGCDDDSVAEKAIELGVKEMESGKFEEAGKYFEALVSVCSSDCVHRQAYESNARVADFAVKSKDRVKKKDFLNAFVSYKRAIEECGDEKVVGVLKNEQGKAVLELLKPENEIGAGFSSDVRGEDIRELTELMWDKASDWETSENEGNEEIAKSAFDKAKSLLENAPTNENCLKLKEIVRLKIEGNCLFNAGLKAQGVNDAEELVRENNNVEALEKYEEAKDKFLACLKLCLDANFEAGVKLLRISINAVSELIATFTENGEELGNSELGAVEDAHALINNATQNMD